MAAGGLTPQVLGIGRLFWAIRDAVVVADAATGRVVLWNPAAEALFGYTAAEATGLPLEVLVPAPLRRAHLAGLARYAETGHGRLLDAGQPVEVPALRKDGAEIWVELSLTPLEHATGRYALALLRDATERQRATKAALAAAEARFRETFEQAAVGIAHVGLDGRWLRVNRRLAEIVGYSLEELLARTFQDITHPDDLDADLALVHKMLTGELDTYNLDKRYIRKDGSVVWITLTVSLVRDPTGAPDYFISVVEAIEARKRAEAAVALLNQDLERRVAERTADLGRALDGLGESRRFFESLVESIPQAVFRKDALGRFTFGNQRFRDTLGKSEADLIGKTDFDFYPAHLAEQYRADDRRVLATGLPLDTVEEHRAPGAGTTWVRVIKTPVSDGEGGHAGVQCVFWDVTSEQEAARLHRESERLAAVARRVAASLDLRETLDAIAQAGLDLLGADTCGLALPDTDGLLAYRSVLGSATQTVQQFHFAPGEGFVGRAFAEGRAQRADDLLASDASHRPDLDRVSGLRAFLAVPLRAQNQVLGVLVAADQTPGVFGGRDERLLERLADQAAVALAHADLYRRARDEVAERERAEAAARTTEREARLLYAAALAIGGETDPGERLERVLDAAMALIGAAQARIALADDETGEIVVVAQRGSGALAPGTRQPAGTGLTGEVLRTARPVRSGDIAADLRAWDRNLPVQDHMPSWLGVPLRDGERAFGALIVLTRERDAFTEADGERLLSLAALAGAAIREARLVEAERTRAASEAATRERDAFSASVVHDLKAPLAALLGRAQLTARYAARLTTPEAERVTAGLAAVEAHARRMARMLDELQDAARLEAGQALVLERRQTDLLVLARAAAVRLGEAAARRVQVECLELALVGLWDADRVERILDNLLSNALKYSPDGGEVRVRLERDSDARGEWAVVSVRDGGLGIPSDDLPRVFDRFHRGANVVGRIAGTGIGLAGVKQIVEQHGGEIAVESVEGDGATFTVRLPLAQLD